MTDPRDKQTATKAPKQPARRKFLTAAAAGTAGAAAAVAMPNVSRAQTVTWRFQSTWPARDIFHEFAADFVRIINEASGGRMKLDLLPAGAVVGALQMQDAVIAGALDGGHGVTAYWYGKHKAYSLFGTPPSFGWDAHQFLAWVAYGGGQELYNELVQDILKLNLVGFLTGPMPTQPLGWFKQPVKDANALKGLKYRTVGLAADLMREFGAAVTIMGGGDIVPAMDRGLLDAAEFNNPSSDRVLGFPDVAKHYMLRSFHQDAEAFEVIFNRQRFEALPGELQAIIRHAANAASADMYYKAMRRYPEDLEAMRQAGVQTHLTPPDLLKAQLAAWNTVIEQQSAADPFFKKVIDSQRAWCEKVVGYHLENDAPKNMAYAHFFGRDIG